MFQECEICESWLRDDQDSCKCGVLMKQHAKRKRKLPCPVWGCKEEASYPTYGPDGKRALFCQTHYEQYRPKSDMDLQFEERLKEARERARERKAPSQENTE